MSDFHPETRTYAGGSGQPQGTLRQEETARETALRGTTQQGVTQGDGQQGTTQQVRETAQQTAQQAKEAAGEVAATAKDQVRTVAQEARDQTRHVVHQLRRRTDEQAWQQSRRAAGAIRQWTEQLESAADGVTPDSPMRDVVRQVADRGRRTADYLETEGLTGAVRDVQDFARRRPGLFLAGALVAGFLAGRAVKAVATAEDPAETDDARRFGSGTAYGSAPDHGRGTAYAPGSPSPVRYGDGADAGNGLTGESVTGSTGTGGPGTGAASPSYGTGTGSGNGTGYETGGRYPAGEFRDGRTDGRTDGYTNGRGDGYADGDGNGRGHSGGFPGGLPGGEPR